MLSFIIPVCHPENAKNWPQLKSFLTETLQSIAAQNNDNWQAVVVSNRGVDLPDLPHKVQVCYVDFPPNLKYDKSKYDKKIVYDAFRLDKGRRVLAGALALRESTDYFMFVDCDDLVSNELAGFTSKHKGENGWFLKYGYVWNDGGDYVLKYKDYSQLCGSSLIIRSDLLNLPNSVEEASEDYIKLMLGSHIANQSALKKRGTPLKALPFIGGVYRVAHSQAHSLSNSLFNQYIFNIRYLIRPHRLVMNLFNLKKINNTIRATFFGY